MIVTLFLFQDVLKEMQPELIFPQSAAAER